MAGFILTKVSEKTLLGKPVEEPDEGEAHLMLELYGLKGDFAETDELEVIHRWLMKARIEAVEFHPNKRIENKGDPRVKFMPLVDHVFVENDTGEKLWVVRCVGSLLAVPGLRFEVDLGSGKFQDVAFGASFRPQDSGGNEPFWLGPGNRLTLEWGGGRPVAEIG